ncbi:MAG: nickel insertion protein [Bacillota bacterium]
MTENEIDDGHHHHHRHYSDIVEIIKNADFNENVQTMALNIFGEIGRAEAKIHNIPFEKVHFHEVGAVDSINDIVGTCILIDHLKVSQIVSYCVHFNLEVWELTLSQQFPHNRN